MLLDKEKTKADEAAKLAEADKPKAAVKPRRAKKPTIHKETQTVEEEMKAAQPTTPKPPKPAKLELKKKCQSLTQIPFEFQDERYYKPKPKPLKTDKKPDGAKGKI